MARGDLASLSVSPWPDRYLLQEYRRLLAGYHGLFTDPGSPRVRGAPDAEACFGMLCRSILKAAPDATAHWVGEEGPQWLERVCASVLQRLRGRYGKDWLQAVASILAMLLHWSLSVSGVELRNGRRPGRLITTYPNPPALGRYLAEVILQRHFVTAQQPGRRGQAQGGRVCAVTVASNRVMDPSFESGQLLLALAEALLRRRHGAEGLVNVGECVDALAAHTLWGIDRNPLAWRAANTVFALLCAEHRVVPRCLENLRSGDALAGDLAVEGEFDAVVNNPPWGERMTPEERAASRSRFTTLVQRTESYIAFAELGTALVRDGGTLALVLPGQATAAPYARAMRGLIAEQVTLDEVVMLPRTAFAPASVRGCLFVGRRGQTREGDTCRVGVFPLSTGGRQEDCRAFDVSAACFREIGGDPWWPLLASEERDRDAQGAAGVVPLSGVAEVLVGVQLYKRTRGVPSQTSEILRRRPYSFTSPVEGSVPALRGRDLGAFCTAPPAVHVRLGPWLAYQGMHYRLVDHERIGIRELVRRDGRLTASVLPRGTVGLHGVFTIVPQGVSAHALVCFLHSGWVARHVRTYTTSASKADFQRVTVAELRQLPIPDALVAPQARERLGLPHPTRAQRRLVAELEEIGAARLSAVNSSASELEPVLQRVDALLQPFLGID